MADPPPPNLGSDVGPDEPQEPPAPLDLATQQMNQVFELIRGFQWKDQDQRKFYVRVREQFGEKKTGLKVDGTNSKKSKAGIQKTKDEQAAAQAALEAEMARLAVADQQPPGEPQEPPASIKYRISIRVTDNAADPLQYDPVTHRDFDRLHRSVDGSIAPGARNQFVDYLHAEAPYFGAEVTKAVRDCSGTPIISVHLMKMEDGEMPETLDQFSKQAGMREMTGDMPQEEGIPVEGTIFSVYGTYAHPHAVEPQEPPAEPQEPPAEPQEPPAEPQSSQETAESSQQTTESSQQSDDSVPGFGVMGTNSDCEDDLGFFDTEAAAGACFEDAVNGGDYNHVIIFDTDGYNPEYDNVGTVRVIREWQPPAEPQELV